jgi:hypothetical protein
MAEPLQGAHRLEQEARAAGAWQQKQQGAVTARHLRLASPTRLET